PGVLTSREQLIRDAWAGASVSDHTCRQAVYRLRSDLRSGGMGELADAVECGEAGSFRIVPVWRRTGATEI
ncbi:MAG: hypothetical protein ABIK89_23295, partial [Planctomycetota bacterium]